MYFIFRVNPSRLFSPQAKIEAYLAKDPNLKASAQRAFVSYAKSVFLMKDKTIFDVRSIDTDKFAR
jgi:ATP-dependent RNA helicase DDX10/DBP4